MEAVQRIDKPTAHNRVVIADDSAEMREMLRGLLERDGFQVVECESGEDLLCRLGLSPNLEAAKAPVDLVISDIRMPGATGLEVLGRLRAAGRSTPVILITAFGDEDTHARAYRLRATLTLDKPFALFELRDAVRALLDPPWW